MKRIISFMLVVALCLTTPAFAAPSPLMDSGVAGTTKLSKYEIKDLLQRTEFTTSAGVWSSAPSLKEPHQVGSVAYDLQNRATNRLNALRILAGVPGVVLDTTMSEDAQYSAIIQAMQGELNHYPDQPKGLPDYIYARGYAASGRCNLAAGMHFNEVVDGLMDDSASKNVATVGHRRWQLNPRMGRVGFGYAENNSVSHRRYATEYVIDMSVERPSYNFISWPASGNFPNNLSGFENNTPWSISLNRGVYAVPDARDISVKLTRISDGTVWEFDGKQTYTTSDYWDYFNVDNGGYGDGFAIIFRPGGVYRYEGVYEVQVSGLRSVSGRAVDLRYQVDFFDPDSLGNPTAPIVPPVVITPTEFTDVPRTHWAYNYIMYAVGDGAVQGVGGGRYLPDNNVTGYEFAAILLRGLFPSALENVAPTTPWYYQIDAAANKMGLWYGLNDIRKDAPVTRYQMAAMVYNALSAMGVSRQGASQHPEIYSGITDWDVISASWEDAVVTCMYYRILQGVGNGRFDGKSNMTRAQAATVYYRLKELVD